MTNIVMFLYGDWGNGKGVLYLRRLIRAIKRNTIIPLRFICICDRQNEKKVAECDCEARSVTLPCWYKRLPKMAAHSSQVTGIEYGQRTIVIDLDMLITGKLDGLFMYSGDFITSCNFKELRKNKYIAGGGLQSFTMGETEGLWYWYVNNTADMIKRTKGNERFAFRLFFEGKPINFWQKKFPGQLLSYKWDVQNKDFIPENTKIVAFHGKPTMWEERDKKAVREHWF